MTRPGRQRLVRRKGHAGLVIRPDAKTGRQGAEKLRQRGHEHRFQDGLIREPERAKCVDVRRPDPRRMPTQLETEPEQAHVCSRQPRVPEIGRDRVDDLRGHAQRLQGARVRGHTVRVPTGCGDGHDEALFLRPAERLLGQQDRVRDPGLGFNSPRQQGLGPEDTRDEAEGLLQVGKRGELTGRARVTGNILSGH